MSPRVAFSTLAFTFLATFLACSASAAAEFDNLELEGFTCNGLLAVFLHEVAVESEAFCAFEGDGCALVGGGGYGAFHDGIYRVLGLDEIPRVGEELLVTEAELVVGLIEIKNLDVDGVTCCNHL